MIIVHATSEKYSLFCWVMNTASLLFNKGKWAINDSRMMPPHHQVQRLLMFYPRMWDILTLGSTITPNPSGSYIPKSHFFTHKHVVIMFMDDKRW